MLGKPSTTPSDFDRCFFRESRGMVFGVHAETIGKTFAQQRYTGGIRALKVLRARLHRSVSKMIGRWYKLFRGEIGVPKA